MPTLRGSRCLYNSVENTFICTFPDDGLNPDTKEGIVSMSSESDLLQDLTDDR